MFPFERLGRDGLAAKTGGLSSEDGCPPQLAVSQSGADGAGQLHDDKVREDGESQQYLPDLPGAAAAHCQVGSPFSGWSIRYLLVLGTGTCAMSHGGQCAGCITR